MLPIVFYRADKRDFAVGNCVVSAGHFRTKNPEGSQLIEDVFEKERPPDLPNRDSLYVFESLSDAKKHWSKMTDGKLYAVEVDPKDVWHRGDMSFVNDAYKNRDKIDFVHDCAQRYWRGEWSDRPIVEVLVRQAHVTEIISNDESERTAFFRSWAISRG